MEKTYPPIPAGPQFIVRAKQTNYQALPIEISNSLHERIERERQNGSLGSIRLDIDYPASWIEIKTASKFLTREYDLPILVFPKVQNAHDHPNIKNEAYTGYYCRFEGQVVLVKTSLDKNMIFDMASVQDISDKKTGAHVGYEVVFPGETYRRGAYLPDLSFRMSKYSYLITTNEREITIFTDEKLDLGASYQFSGLVWSAVKSSDPMAIKNQDVYMIVDQSISARKLMVIGPEFFNKFIGKSKDDCVNSCAYPFHNSLSEYKEMVFLAIFYIRSSLIPLNILIMGGPGCTKSAFLKKLAAISGDKMIDSGSSTLKGLLPSFSIKNLHPGEMAVAKHFVILNEFFEIVRSANSVEDSMNALSKLKNILEGEVVPCSSGNGRMEILMRGSVFMASNWVSYGKTSIRLSTVKEMYSIMDPALMDRMVIYPVNPVLQNELVNQHRGDIDALFDSITAQTGEKNEIKLLEKMENPFGLDAITLRTLLQYKEQLTPRLSRESTALLSKFGNKIQAKYSYEIYTRAQDFIKNIATAYSLARELSAGRLNNESVYVDVIEEDITQAAHFYMITLELHSSAIVSDKVMREEMATSGLSFPAKFVLNELSKVHNGLTKFIHIEALYRMTSKKYPEVLFYDIMKILIDNNLAAFDGENVIFVDYRLDSGVLSAMKVGGSALTPYLEILYNHGLLDSRDGGDVKCRWRFETPEASSAGAQKAVIEIFQANVGMMNPDEIHKISVISGLTNDPQEILKTLRYLHFSGRLIKKQDTYGLNPNWLEKNNEV